LVVLNGSGQVVRRRVFPLECGDSYSPLLFFSSGLRLVEEEKQRRKKGGE
jgi:hypothetical protein